MRSQAELVCVTGSLLRVRVRRLFMSPVRVAYEARPHRRLSFGPVTFHTGFFLAFVEDPIRHFGLTPSVPGHSLLD